MARLNLPTADRIPGGRGFASLSRRVRTLIVSGILFVVLFVLVFTLPVPYVVLSPGPTCNTLGTCYGQQVVKIKGIELNRTSGHLNLTTVGVSTTSVTPFEAFLGWLHSDEVVVPRTSIYPPGQSEQQTNQQNTQDFVQSQDSAVAAASCELGYPSVAVNVLAVVAGSGAAGALVSGEQIRSIDGTPTVNAAALRTMLMSVDAGTTVQVGLTRNGKPRTVPVTLGTPPSGERGGRLGIEVNNVCKAPFTVDLGLANEIGGPSAGMMFALGIIDKVGPDDLTKGRFIAGTGTIDANGNVGPIGGIALKMIAARAKGATVFLAPAGNCGDVVKAVPSGLEVVKVSTLAGAVQDLQRLENRQAVPHC